MGKLCAVISCLLLAVGAVTVQTAQTQVSERLLPQWLTGIIAVSAFLFLAFVVVLVKKAWCEEPGRSRTTVETVRGNEYVDDNTYDTSLDMVRSNNVYDTSLDMVRSKEDINAYDNLVIDSTDDKVTSM